MSEFDGVIDAYVFIRNANEEYLQNLIQKANQSETPIRYAAVLTGEFDAIAAVTLKNLKQLEGLIFKYFRTNPTTETAIGMFPRAPSSFKWSTSFPVEAIVRIWVEPGAAISVAGELAMTPGVDGAVIVASDFDILAGVGGQTFEDVRASLLSSVPLIPGIVRTASHFVVASSDDQNQQA